MSPEIVVETPQPTRRGIVKKARRFDKTQLRAHQHGRYVHRDYAAHFFRWGWVSRQIKAGARILDVGCGQDLPLMWVLNGLPSNLPSYYLGVDLNPVPQPGLAWAGTVSPFNFVDDFIQLYDNRIERFDVATCFECIEHMQPADGRKLLEGFMHWLKPGGRLYLSTPVFDGFAAANHLHEYQISELQELIESTGFVVSRRYGTFANIPALKKVMTAAELEVMESLSGYYSNDVLSCMFAPNYPDHSRNNVWECVKPA